MRAAVRGIATLEMWRERRRGGGDIKRSVRGWSAVVLVRVPRGRIWGIVLVWQNGRGAAKSLAVECVAASPRRRGVAVGAELVSGRAEVCGKS